MKKVLFLMIVFVLALGAGCKKKAAPVEAPPPPPPPPKQTEQEAIKGLISNVPRLELGKILEVPVDKSKVISDETSFLVSLFPLEFIYPAGRKYVVSYMFPAVVWRLTDSQLLIRNLYEYLNYSKPGEKIWLLKNSPNPKVPFKHIPTLLVETKDKSKFWVLDQTGDEMPLRANWGK
jgi:hypothetical protein